ncbi:MAG TPA: alpha/beta fold hydrolase [Burkholderiales bacterium]|nr:alpha/beta fold hydrolase [Burkholderiales bacterium]
MATVAIAGGQMYYEEAGSGEPLIFVSGLNGVARYWQPQVAFFSTRFRVITYDHRGTGSSDKLQREFSIVEMTAELVELMDALHVARAHVVGLSTGGAIAQTLGIEYPDRVSRLVMCSTWTHCDPWFRRLFEARRAMFAQCGPELHAMFHPLWLLPPDYVNAHDAEIDEERRRSVSAAPPVEVSIGRIDALLRFDRRAGLANIRAPTLILAALNDYITPCYHGVALAEAIPGAQLEMLDGGGHSISKTRADYFNRRVMDFLTA